MTLCFGAARGDIPVDVAHVVAERVFHDLIELHAAATKRRAILAAEDVLDGVADAPLELAQEGEGRAGLGGFDGHDQTVLGTGVLSRTWATIFSGVISSASAS